MSSVEPPVFQQLQRQLTGYVRDPAAQAPPMGVEPRRLKIYQELFFNNIEGFVSGTFPVLRSLYSAERWQALVREFMVAHYCQTPYFLEISQEFLAFIQHRPLRADDPAFLVELAHYEWVELALDVAEDDVDAVELIRDGDLLVQQPVLSPVAWPLAYQYPVHKLGPSYQPEVAPAEPSYLVVYRNRADEVKFMELNDVSARLLALLQERASVSGEQTLRQLATELHHPNPEQVISSGLDLFEQFRCCDIVLGSRPL
jgi:hypothetical protein